MTAMVQSMLNVMSKFEVSTFSRTSDIEFCLTSKKNRSGVRRNWIHGVVGSRPSNHCNIGRRT